MEVKELTIFALNLPFVKNHSDIWGNDDLLRVAYDLAVHVKKNGVSSKETVVSNVVEAVSLVVDELVKSDPEKSKNLKDYVVNYVPSLLLASSLFDNGVSHFLRKLFCYCVSVDNLSEKLGNLAEKVSEEVKEVAAEVVAKVSEEVKEVAAKVSEEVKEVAVKVAEKKKSLYIYQG
jgi:hypothetical protein